jgi:hypothetical protein
MQVSQQRGAACPMAAEIYDHQAFVFLKNSV